MRTSITLAATLLPMLVLVTPAAAGKDEPAARAAADAFRGARVANSSPTDTWTAPGGHGVYLPFDGQGHVDVTGPKGTQRFSVSIDGKIRPFLAWGGVPSDAEAQAKAFIESGSLVERTRGPGVSWYSLPHLVVTDADGVGWHRYTYAPGGGIRLDERVRRQKNGSWVTTTPTGIRRQVARIAPGRFASIEHFDVVQLRGAGGRLGPVQVAKATRDGLVTYRDGHVFDSAAGHTLPNRLADAPTVLDARYQAARGHRAPRAPRR